MEQYLQLLRDIQSKGTIKSAARENMPYTKSLFGYQFRHDLGSGFPLLTTKEINFKHIIIELLWFLRGDTNIKYLLDNGVNIWNEDAYNYYLKIFKKYGTSSPMDFEIFIEFIKNEKPVVNIDPESGYNLGDCGEQYGALWRKWSKGSGKLFQVDVQMIPSDFDAKKFLEEYKKVGLLPLSTKTSDIKDVGIDQIKDLITGLIDSPMSRRHIITAWNPETLDDMALNACHAMVQFNCRPISLTQRLKIYEATGDMIMIDGENVEKEYEEWLDNFDVPKYYLDCQMYQRSADVFLGVPYNIASYALLTHIVAKICKMVPGDFIHTFGDVHIYENHMEQVEEQLKREPFPLPTLEIVDEGNDWAYIRNFFDFSMLDTSDFILTGYKSHSKIKGKLSTGLK